ncbi:MAG: MFS transporter [Chloroflexi bacterium]|nr:MFS transporter [Chloroflexota bacterium]
MKTYLNLLRNNSNYRYLWLGSVVSQLGDWFNLLASAELITEITSSGVAVSYLFLSRFLPLFLVSPFAGVVADRYNRRLILIVSDVLRALTVLGFLVVRSTDEIWLFYLLTVLQFCLSAFFTPARSAVIANIVDRDDLVTANALDSFTWSTMLAMGAFLGGVITAVFGATTAFILDAFTFLLSAIFIMRVVVPPRHGEGVQVQGGWLDFVDGFRYLLREPFILTVALLKAAGSLVWGAINVLEIPFANEVFPLQGSGFMDVLQIENGGTATLGIIYVISGVGTGFGPLLMRQRLGDSLEKLLIGISIGFMLTGSGILLLGFVPTLSTYLGATLVRTVGTGCLWVFSAVILQMIVPNRYRGRVFAFEFAVLTLMQSISTLAAGFMQDNLGWSVQRVAIVMGSSGIVVSLVWLGVFAYWIGRVRDGRVSMLGSVAKIGD